MRAAGVNGRKRSTVSGVHRVQKRPRLGSTNLPKDDAVRTVAERGLEQVIEGDGMPVGIGLGLLLDHMRFADVQLGGVFDNQDALVLRDGVGEHVEHGRFAC